MFTVVLQVLGWTAFIIVTLVLGTWLRRNHSRVTAEETSRVLHFLFWLSFGFFGVIGAFYPGLTGYDEILGIRSLPFRPASLVVGVFLLLAGFYLTLVSNVALRRLGKGANAFRLTKRLVESDIYERVRNPMSLGFYLICVGIGLMAGSTYITLGSLIGVIPVHIFYLKYFEEYELELRLGQSYIEYKGRVPFLVPRLYLKGGARNR
jgi:protein-S-isoprenylcysteine O-methyltransferase Ste14